MGTHDWAGRLVGKFSGKYSSSELRRDPGVDWAEKRLLGVWDALVFTWLAGGEVMLCEGANTLNNPAEVVTLEVEKRVGREKAVGKPASRLFSGGVVGSLTGPAMPTLARLRAIWSSSWRSFSCCWSRSFISASNLFFCSRIYSIC